MKRILICAAAAIVALASCSKTQVVYNDAPEEIGFKAVSGVMTKAPIGDKDYTTMGVFANYSPTGGGYTELPAGVTAYNPYLTNKEFTDKTTYWGGTTAQYWPLVGRLDFVVYAPFANGVVRTYSAGENKLEVPVSNETLGSQEDWMYGETMLSSMSKSNEAMAINIRHALAKITVSVTSDLEGLIINSLVIDDTEQQETFTVDYSGTDADYTDGDTRLTWTNDEDAVDMTLITNHTAVKDVAESAYCYVIPSDQTSITMTYTLPGAGSPLPYKHTFTTGKWVENHHYTYAISIGVNEIKFNPTETEWSNETEVPITVDPNTPNN